MNKNSHKKASYIPSVFQGRMDFSAVSKPHRALAMEHPAEAYALRTLSILLIVLTCAYLYFVAASVLNVMARKEALSQSMQLEGTIGDMESRYFSLSQSVTPEAGASMGLQSMNKPGYVYRPGNVGEANTSADKEI